MNSEIGRTTIDEKTRMKLWAVSGGRCEMCNRILYQDLVYGVGGNFGEMAHIHAVSEGGPRHKTGMTREEKNNIENLMLLCEEHHHMIDSRPEDFGEGLLLQKKKDHENRIRMVTEIPAEQSCRIVSFFSNIDQHQIYSSDRLLREAVLFSKMVPMQEPTIDLSSQSYSKCVPSKEIIQQRAKELEQKFHNWFDAAIKSKDCVGIFALAPQSLLIKLGTLINDQYNVIAFQCHRTGHKWAWPIISESINYTFSPAKKGTDKDKVALVIDLSAPVLDDRIISVLGEESTIFHLTIANPCRSFVKSVKVQDDFVEVFRMAMEHLKNLRPMPQFIHLFPVMPNSLAIRAGMDYMPKTDLPLIIYEQANQNDGFFAALGIGN